MCHKNTSRIVRDLVHLFSCEKPLGEWECPTLAKPQNSASWRAHASPQNPWQTPETAIYFRLPLLHPEPGRHTYTSSCTDNDGYKNCMRYLQSIENGTHLVNGVGLHVWKQVPLRQWILVIYKNISVWKIARQEFKNRDWALFNSLTQRLRASLFLFHSFMRPSVVS